jgi:hypothetical protein
MSERLTGTAGIAAGGDRMGIAAEGDEKVLVEDEAPNSPTPRRRGWLEAEEWSGGAGTEGRELTTVRSLSSGPAENTRAEWIHACGSELPEKTHVELVRCGAGATETAADGAGAVMTEAVAEGAGAGEMQAAAAEGMVAVATEAGAEGAGAVGTQAAVVEGVGVINALCSANRRSNLAFCSVKSLRISLSKSSVEGFMALIPDVSKPDWIAEDRREIR